MNAFDLKISTKAETSGSMKGTKSNGDNKHPCLVPLFGLNDLDICPFVIMDAGVLYRIVIQVKLKPKWFKDMNRKGQLTLS